MHAGVAGGAKLQNHLIGLEIPASGHGFFNDGSHLVTHSRVVLVSHAWTDQMLQLEALTASTSAMYSAVSRWASFSPL